MNLPKVDSFSKLTHGDLQVIASIAVFRGLRPESVEHIVCSATAVTLSDHELLFLQDTPAKAFFIVVSGHVKLFRITPSGEEAIIRIMSKGQSVAEASALTGGQYLASGMSVGEARVVCVPAEHVNQCIRDSLDIALAMIASTSRHLERLMLQVEQLKAQSGVQRVAEFLISLSSVNKGHCDIKLPYDKKLIAARLGLNAESLSRAFARLKAFGVTVHKSFVSITEITILHQLARKDRAEIRGKLKTGTPNNSRA